MIRYNFHEQEYGCGPVFVILFYLIVFCAIYVGILHCCGHDKDIPTAEKARLDSINKSMSKEIILNLGRQP